MNHLSSTVCSYFSHLGITCLRLSALQPQLRLSGGLVPASLPVPFYDSLEDWWRICSTIVNLWKKNSIKTTPQKKDNSPLVKVHTTMEYHGTSPCYSWENYIPFHPTTKHPIECMPSWIPSSTHGRPHQVLIELADTWGGASQKKHHLMFKWIDRSIYCRDIHIYIYI